MSEHARPDHDLFARPASAVLLWGVPLVALVVTGIAPVGMTARTITAGFGGRRLPRERQVFGAPALPHDGTLLPSPRPGVVASWNGCVSSGLPRLDHHWCGPGGRKRAHFRPGMDPGQIRPGTRGLLLARRSFVRSKKALQRLDDRDRAE